MTEDFIAGILIGAIGGAYVCMVTEFACRQLGAWTGRHAAERTMRKWEKERLEQITTGSNNVAIGALPGIEVDFGRTMPDYNVPMTEEEIERFRKAWLQSG